MAFVVITICLVAFILIDAVLAAIVFSILVKPSGKNVLGKKGSRRENVDLTFEELSIQSNDKKKLYAYFISNPDSNILLVALHGYGSNAQGLASFINHFQSYGCNILVPNLRGHGQSEGICGLGYSDAKDISAWIDFLEKTNNRQYRVVLFGTSMGATTAINTALNSSDGRVDGISGHVDTESIQMESKISLDIIAAVYVIVSEAVFESNKKRSFFILQDQVAEYSNPGYTWQK